MPLLVNNKIINIEAWTDKTSVILHCWGHRQKFTEGKWIGDADLTLFMGNKRMRILYNYKENKYKIHTNNLEDPTLLHEFLVEFCDILMIKKEDLVKLVEPGDWIIKDDKILHALQAGFKITSQFIEIPIHFDEPSITVTKDKITLYDKFLKKIYTTPTGLLSCTYENIEMTDFEAYGLSFKKMLSNNVFTYGFDILMKDKSTVRDLLDNLVVIKPEVTQVTKEKLKLKESWAIKASTEIKEEIEIKEENIMSPMSILSSLDIKDLTLSDIKWDTSPILNFIDEFKESGLFNTAVTVTKVEFPVQMLNNVMNLKYDCICMLTTNMALINQNTIKDINNLINDNRQAVLYSLISRYDRFVSNVGIGSPSDVVIAIDQHLRELGLTTREDRELE